MSTAAKLIDVSGRVPLYSIHASEVKSKKFRLKISGGTGIIKEVLKNMNDMKKIISDVKTFHSQKEKTENLGAYWKREARSKCKKSNSGYSFKAIKCC